MIMLCFFFFTQKKAYYVRISDWSSDVCSSDLRQRLAVADKPDSHDICFIADGDTAGFLDRHLGSRPGAIADESGATIGSHDGTHHFTIGQRKGLKIGDRKSVS